MATATFNQPTSAQAINIHSTRAVWLGGVETGVVAGIAMAMVTMLTSYFMGTGFLTPLLLISATFFGQAALAGGVGVIAAGVVLHMMNSAVFGVIFAYITRQASSGGTYLWAGLAFGIAIWAMITFAVLPVADPIMRQHVAMTPIPWFVNHLVFGAMLALTPYFERISVRRT